MIELEVRRQVYLTEELKLKVIGEFERPEKEVYIIFFGKKRAILNGVPRIEKKICKAIKPIIIFSGAVQSIEISYISEEYQALPIITNSMIKHGVLVKKSYYFIKESCVLYTLENLEVTLQSLQLHDKLVLELENPLTASEDMKAIFINYVFMFQLEFDPKHLNVSVEEVKFDPNITVSDAVFPKVDGERGIVYIYDEFENFTSNTESYILSPSLRTIFGDKICFFLKNIPIIVEKVGSILVIIDLALAEHFNANERLDFIFRLGKFVRTINLVSSKDSYVFFQGYDVKSIRENCKLDGEIVIFKDELFKIKTCLTVDLQYLSSCAGMVDNNNILYKVKVSTDNLVNKKIYECVIGNDNIVNCIYRIRNDKFFPNSRSTVQAILEVISGNTVCTK